MTRVAPRLNSRLVALGSYLTLVWWLVVTQRLAAWNSNRENWWNGAFWFELRKVCPSIGHQSTHSARVFFCSWKECRIFRANHCMGYLSSRARHIDLDTIREGDRPGTLTLSWGTVGSHPSVWILIEFCIIWQGKLVLSLILIYFWDFVCIFRFLTYFLVF